MNQTTGCRYAAFAAASLLALGLSACSNTSASAGPKSVHGDMYLPAPGPGQTEPAYTQSNSGGMLLPAPGPGHVEPPYDQTGNTNNGGMLLPPPGPGTTEPAGATPAPSNQ